MTTLQVIPLREWLPQKADRDRNAFAVIVKNFLTEEECQRMINEVEKADQFSNDLEQHKSLRDSFRSVFDDGQLAEKLFKSIESILPKEWDPARCSRGDVNTDLCKRQARMKLKLKLKGVNERFRCLRYDQGQYFNAHVDGYFVRPPTCQTTSFTHAERGVLTIQIYLNRGYSGGTTRFISPACNSFMSAGVCEGEVCQYGVCKDPPVECGDAVIFQHDLWHQGSPLIKGRKYTCRTEVMYQCEEDE